MNKTRLFALLTLVGLTLSGCSNPTDTDSIIEDAKDNLQTDEQVKYEKHFEERFNWLLERIEEDEYYNLIGYSLENRVVVVSRDFFGDYTDLTERASVETHSLLLQYKMGLVGVNDVTIYVEYYNENSEQIALLTVTKDSYEIEEVK